MWVLLSGFGEGEDKIRPTYNCPDATVSDNVARGLNVSPFQIRSYDHGATHHPAVGGVCGNRRDGRPAFGESFLLAPENAIPLHSTTQPALTDSPLDLWLAGKKDAALAAFLATDWTTGGFLTADPILGLTEAEFDQRMANDPKLQQELTDRTNALKSLSKEVLTRGDADVKNAKPTTPAPASSMSKASEPISPPMTAN